MILLARVERLMEERAFLIFSVKVSSPWAAKSSAVERSTGRTRSAQG